jgi:hypothetical protein
MDDYMINIIQSLSISHAYIELLTHDDGE